jgi:hypothetical protein
VAACQTCATKSGVKPIDTLLAGIKADTQAETCAACFAKDVPAAKSAGWAAAAGAVRPRGSLRWCRCTAGWGCSGRGAVGSVASPQGGLAGGRHSRVCICACSGDARMLPQLQGGICLC